MREREGEREREGGERERERGQQTTQKHRKKSSAQTDKNGQEIKKKTKKKTRRPPPLPFSPFPRKAAYATRSYFVTDWSLCSPGISLPFISQNLSITKALRLVLNRAEVTVLVCQWASGQI